jgi:hypothetical protein
MALAHVIVAGPAGDNLLTRKISQEEDSAKAASKILPHVSAQRTEADTKIRRHLELEGARSARARAINATVYSHCGRQLVFVYGVMFTVPTLLMFLYTGGKTSLSPEELLATETARRRVRCRLPCHQTTLSPTMTLPNRSCHEVTTLSPLNAPEFSRSYSSRKSWKTCARLIGP